MYIKECMNKEDHRLQPLEFKQNNIIRDVKATDLILTILKTDWAADNETGIIGVQKIQKLIQRD